MRAASLGPALEMSCCGSNDVCRGDLYFPTMLDALVLSTLLAAPASPAPPIPSAPPVQTDSDEYTRYELLQPGTGRFHILYEVTATTPGATRYFNPIR